MGLLLLQKLLKYECTAIHRHAYNNMYVILYAYRHKRISCMNIFRVVCLYLFIHSVIYRAPHTSLPTAQMYVFVYVCMHECKYLWLVLYACIYVCVHTSLNVSKLHVCMIASVYASMSEGSWVRRHVYLRQFLHSQLPVALRRETPTEYPCCVRGASE